MTRVRRTILFAPADRPDRVAKAAALATDGVVVELEDGVGPDRKELAREQAGRLLAEVDFGGREVIVRVNRLTTLYGLADLLALANWPRKPDAIVLPKVESAAEVKIYSDLMDQMGAACEFLPVVESSRGVQNAAAIAAAPRVACLLFGGVDLAADIGSRSTWEPMLAHRSGVVLAAATAGVPVMDVPYLNIGDTEGLMEETRRIRDLGMVGKVCIHPSQLEPVNRVFTPTPAEVERARRIVAADRAQGGGVLVVDGQMIDRPVVKSAERVVAIAERAGLG